MAAGLVFFEDSTSKASERETVDKVELSDKMLQCKDERSFQTQLTLRLVRQVSTDDECDTYIGCGLNWKDGLDSKHIFAFMIVVPISCPSLKSTTFFVSCKKVMMINSDDVKLQMAVSGLSPDPTHNCEHCLCQKRLSISAVGI